MFKIQLKLYLKAVLVIIISSIFIRAQESVTDAGSCNLRGIELAGAGKYNEAIMFFDRAVKLDPNFAKAYFNLGTAYYHQKNFLKAIEALQRAVKIDPLYANAYNQLGLTLADDLQFVKGQAALDEAIRQDPNHPVYHYNLGYLYNRWGKFKAAVKSLERSRQLAPERSETWVNLGFALIGLKRYRQAIEALQQAVTLDGNGVEARVFLAKAYMLANDKPSALALYERVRSFDSAAARKLYEIIYQDKVIILETKK